MSTLNLYNNIAEGTLLSGPQNSSQVNPLTLQLYYGDTVQVNIWFFQPLSSVNPAANFPFQAIPTPGLAAKLILYDGTINGSGANTPGSLALYGANNPFASCVNFQPDPTGTFLTGTLNLNTAGLKWLLGVGKTGFCYLGVGYFPNGNLSTVLDVQVAVGVGVTPGVLVVPPGLTPLSLEVARNLFVSIQPVAGQAFYLMTPLGVIIEQVPTDDPASPGNQAHIQENIIPAGAL